MRIIKHPDFEVITCEKCGTVFQPEPGDTFEYAFGTLLELRQPFIRCPVCERYCEVKTATEK